jgi:MFS transporter, DHA2 family, multidrug resistance protein
MVHPHNNSSTLHPGKERTRAGAREWAALLVLALAVLVLAVDAGVLALAIPALTESLQPSNTQILWIGDVYSFALAGLLVTMGSLGDRIGRKRLLLIGSAGFAVMSVLAAYSPSATWLIAMRGGLGIAGATLMPSTLSIIRNMFLDRRQRSTAIAVWTAMATIGAAAGPLIGGALLEHFWWGSVFLINVPVMIGLIVFGSWLLPESRDPDPAPIDLPSIALSLIGILAVVYTIKELAAGEQTPIIGVIGMIGIVALVGFGLRQQQLANPMIDVSLFTQRVFAGAVIVNMLAIFALAGLMFFISLYFQLVLGYGPLEAGLRQLPVTMGALVASAVVGLLLRRFAPHRLIALGMMFTAFGLLGMAWAEASAEYLGFALALALVGVGVVIALTLTVDLVVAAVPSEKAGAASAVSETGYELGSALGIALLGSVLTASYRSNINELLSMPPNLPSELRSATQDSLVATMDAASRVPSALSDPVVTVAQDAFVNAMQVTSIAGAVVASLAAAVAWLGMAPVEPTDPG